MPTDYISLIKNSAQLTLIETFIADLEISLSTRRRDMSLEALWNRSPPEEAGGIEFAEYMKDVRSSPYSRNPNTDFMWVRFVCIPSGMMIFTTWDSSVRTIKIDS